MKKFLIFVVLFALISMIYIFHIKKQVNSEIYIKKGQSISKIAEKLERKDIIFSKKLFLIYSLIRNKPLKAGYYRFKGDYSISDIWYRIYKGKEDLIKITITAGDDLFVIADKLDKKGIIKGKNFLKFAFNKKFLKKIGINHYSFEGFIYPDTYFLPKNISAEKLFTIFLKKFKEEYKVKDINDKNFYQKMIIASLIEKETSDFNEKRIIAGIIYKRLKIRMPLQIDASVIYAKKLKNIWNGKLSKEDYLIESPFNTYKIYGLPPSPISSFSKESFKAVQNPLKTDYLYYFTKDGKKHIFSKTFKEHLRKLRGGR